MLYPIAWARQYFMKTDYSPLGPIPEGWRLVKLKEITTKIGSGATPKGGEAVYLPYREQAALIRSQNVFDRHFDLEGLAFISNEHAAELDNVVLQAGDVLLNITGDGITFGRACQVPADILPARVNQHVSIIRADPQRCEPGYMLSYLTHPAIKDYIESFNAGGSRRAITKGHIEAFEMPLPPLTEQRAIAHILGTLDDKIELNRRMNETLEAMARAIFKSWFVDFDPVRANAEGSQPAGMDAETAALFPGSFEDSAVGTIPKGWKLGKLGDIADVNWGDTKTTKSSYVERGYPAFSAKGQDGYLPYYDYDKTGIVVSAIGANSGATWLTIGKWSCIKNTIRFWATSDYISTEYLYYATLGNDKWPHRGSAQPFISQSDARAMKILIPSNNLAIRFAEIAKPMFEIMKQHGEQSRTLAALRDALLPKLMSGEVRVKI